MIEVVTAANRAGQEGLMRSMFHDRKRVFVDRMKWDISVVKGDLEIDQFDHDEAVYLIAQDGAGNHLGSCRLLPSTGPHILQDVFPQLCDGGEVPTGEGIWEMTRLVYSPDIKDMAVLNRVRMRLRMAMIEFALAAGISHYTAIIRMDFLPTAISAGWELEPLGFPLDIDGESTTAVMVTNNAAALAHVRQRSGLHEPVLDLSHLQLAKAA